MEENFYKSLEEKLHLLEVKRQKIVRWLTIFATMSFLLSLFSIYYLWGSIGEWELLVATFAAFVLATPTYLHQRKRWSEFFKEEILSTIFKNFFPSLTYRPKEYIPKELFISSLLFADSPRPDRYRGEDRIEGKVGSTDIALSEVWAEYMTETTDSEGNREVEWHTIFKGVFFVAKFPKRARSTVLVYPSTFRFFGTPAKLQRVKLEDPEFEKHFDVFSNDQIEARYILSLSLMRRMLDFVLKTRARVRFSFMGEYMFCAMDFGKNFFKAPSLFRSVYPLLYEEGYRQYVKEVELLISIVEELNLNQRIWL